MIHRTGIRDFWTTADRDLLPPETANYVPSVLAASRLLLENSKPNTEAQAPSKISEDSPTQAKPNAREAETNFPDPPAISKDVDDEISRLREQLRGRPGQVVSRGMRIMNPESHAHE